MLRILIDTCVWLDVAKDYRQRNSLYTLEKLIELNDVELIVPKIVVDEFDKNKTRIIEESNRGLSSVFRRVLDAVQKFGPEEKKNELLAELHNLDHRIITLSEAADHSIQIIEELLRSAKIIETSDNILIKASQRALNQKAPFHRQRNGIADAILIEIYAEQLKDSPQASFAFVTHNIRDFSHPNGDSRLPHPDIAEHFGTLNSQYSTRISEVLAQIRPDLLDDIQLELEGADAPRRLTEITDAIDLLFHQVWYNRHWNLRHKIEIGDIKIVDHHDYSDGNYRSDIITKDIWEGALRAAEKTEEEYGIDNLGPWDDFEWGMINGKLSALRWVLGDEWDMLDT